VGVFSYGWKLTSEIQGWEQLSAWYDSKHGETGDLWHRSLIDPVLIHLVGMVNGKRILDLGCGNGYLARRFAREGAAVTAIDASPGMIERALAHDPESKLGIDYRLSSASNLGPLEDGTFDIVFANMSLMDIEDAEAAIGEVARVLKTRGRFVASISHPCFDNGKDSAWIMEKTIGDNGLETKLCRKITRYRQRSSQLYPWRISDYQRGWTRGYHRPLNWYASAFKSAGLAITALEEPEPMTEFLEEESDSRWFLEVPLHIVFEAIKI
jgi:ubiquinone/menaquinone biosynthesis C-methylase UbiE